MTIENHWLREARHVASPNFNERPPGQQPELIVVHCISLPPGQFGGCDIEQFFQNKLDPQAHPYFATICDLQVSSHLLITRAGEIIQFVGFDKRAWHAGDSCYGERSNCNDFSIGIELEGTDDSSFEPIQYERLSASIKQIWQAYPKLSPQAITAHSDIAPGRKTDPGPFFDWALLQQLLVQPNAS